MRTWRSPTIYNAQLHQYSAVPVRTTVAYGACQIQSLFNVLVGFELNVAEPSEFIGFFIAYQNDLSDLDEEIVRAG